MEIVILGLKHSVTGEYMFLDVESRRNNNVRANVGEEVVLDTLAPYPYQYFSTLIFDSRADLAKEWDGVYLRVDAEITEEEYSKMNTTGIMYYRFDNRKVTFIREETEPLTYALEKYLKFPKEIGGYNVSTWITNEPARSERELESLRGLISACINDYKKTSYSASFQIYGTHDQRLPIILDLISKGEKVELNSMSRYDREPRKFGTRADNLRQEDLVQMIISSPTHWAQVAISHKSFTPSTWRNYIVGTENELAFLNSIYDDELKILSDKGFPMGELLLRLITIREEFMLESINWVYGESKEKSSIREALEDENYPTREETHSPWDYYCCEECEGYNIHDVYTDEELEPRITVIDDRVTTLATLMNPWSKYLTKDDGYIVDFIPKGKYDLFKEEEVYEFLSLLI